MPGCQRTRRLVDTHQHSSSPAAQAIRQALEILARASADWRGTGAADAGSVHWPLAVELARRELAQALEVLEPRREVGSLAGNDRGLDAVDARIGMAWFNSLSPTRRREWLEAAHSVRPVDAWTAFKAQGG